ncbi:MAG TPA: RimK family alpha-L-glutamate ligase [Clostridiales bacterium]|nr:RimK family alpha-L-glutamate ligase [Clostridiales bacterium]
MIGWLVVNEFLHSNKFNEIHQWLSDAGMRQGINLVLKTNGELLIDLPGNKLKEDVDFVLFWDKDVRLAKHLEQLGYPVFNSSNAIEICDDKSLTHLTLMNENIKMPRTIIAPKTFDNIGYTNLEFAKEAGERLGYPLLLKECFGSFGQQVYLINDLEELENKIEALGTRPILFQEFISSSFGRDVRIQVVGSKVVASMYRHSDNGDFRANLSIGGKMEMYIPTEEQSRLAIGCCEIIGLDFAGVDILFGNDDEPIICEVNSNAHFKNIFDCTGINVADEIIAYIKNKLNVDYM